ncbi:MAG TPA: LysR family transcriptional regulator [Xanthobacteraceae bacterium]|nr:LysR family transcriptional regulator [Xanthobacteraceae bacterium]
MEIHQVRYFLAVAETLNFTCASEKCNVTQPSLSRAIKLLEEELGGPPFHRDREFTHLTDLGQLLHPHLQSVYDHTKRAKQLSLDFFHRLPLKLGIMSTISPDEIVDLITNLRTRHPDVDLKLCDASAEELRARLLTGDLEAVIYALPGAEPDDRDRIHSIPLFRERMVLAVHRGHRLANEPEFPVREMNGEHYIHRMNCEFAGYADEILQQKGVTCTPAYWSERDDWTLAMVAAGLGFAFMPANSVKHSGVVGLPIVEPEFWRDVHLVYVKGRPHSPSAGSLVREAMRKTWFGKLPISAGI